MNKITPDHLPRSACVYVRQSVPDQLVDDPESRRREYALASRARLLNGLGWLKAIVDYARADSPRRLPPAATASARKQEDFFMKVEEFIAECAARSENAIAVRGRRVRAWPPRWSAIENAIDDYLLSIKRQRNDRRGAGERCRGRKVDDGPESHLATATEDQMPWTEITRAQHDSDVTDEEWIDRAVQACAS